MVVRLSFVWLPFSAMTSKPYQISPIRRLTPTYLQRRFLHNCTIEEVRKEKKEAQAEGRDDWRQLAKPDTYKPLYGGKYGSPEQERYYTYFRNRYHGIAKTQEQWVNEAVETKRLVTPWGLV
jgi:hypothetical protein